jgi:hypothetical protein
VPSQHPVYLAVNAQQGARVNDCFPIVQDQVAARGGSMCCGWRIWEVPDLLLEAEFHAVWQDPNGILADISPTESGDEQVLFLADPSRQYEDKQVNNVRIPLSDRPAVRDFIAACDAEFEILNRGERASQHGRVELQDNEALEMQQVRQKKLAALSSMIGHGQPVEIRTSPKIGRNDPCSCGSGKKYKKCCGS